MTNSKILEEALRALEEQRGLSDDDIEDVLKVLIKAELKRMYEKRDSSFLNGTDSKTLYLTDGAPYT